MLRPKIKKWFEEAIRLNMEAPEELKRMLLRGHPKVEGFLDHITGQVIQADKLCLARGLVLKEKTIQDTVYDMTKYFMAGIELEAKKRYESDLARSAREAEAQKIKEFDAVLAGQAEGEFAEAGVISNDKVDAQREAALEAQDRAQKVKASKHP